ncbi:Fic family protein [Nitrososphaera sp.]|uniref:Fic family protein n=1 Tax=Nitrososphaera sp. TaxID=1971748 RepID=UPI003459575E
MDFYYVSYEVAVSLHSKAVTGERVRDPGRLRAILDTVQDIGHRSSEKDAIAKKAAYLLCEISWQQPFTKGNKRASFVISSTFLRINGWRFLPIITWDTMFDLIMAIAQRKKSRQQVETFMKTFLVPSPQL